MGHVGNLTEEKKALHHRKHHPWDRNVDMGTLLKGRIYSAIFMRKCYVALKVFCLKNQLRQVHIQQLYLLFHFCNNEISWMSHFMQVFWYSLPQEQSIQACPCPHTPFVPNLGLHLPSKCVLAEGSVTSPRQGLFLILFSTGRNVLQIFIVR